MFIINLTYIAQINDIDKFMDNHLEFLDKYYDLGKFIMSGRKNPRVGGVIIAKADDLEEIDSIMRQDPFIIKNLAKYEIIEFAPTRSLFPELLEKSL